MEAKLFARKSRNFSDASGREVDYGSKLTSKSEVCPKWYNVVQISGPTGPIWSLIIIWICSREIPDGELFCSIRNTCGTPCKDVQVFTTERL